MSEEFPRTLAALLAGTTLAVIGLVVAGSSRRHRSFFRNEQRFGLWYIEPSPG